MGEDRPKRRSNLPLPRTPFVGRESDIEQAKGLISRYELVTLTGTGGVGKTRLAIHVAGQMAAQFPDGVWYIELASITDPTLIVQVVSSVLGVNSESGKSEKQTLIDYLNSETVLLVLDNCEHLIDACAQFCDYSLSRCANLRIMATSRERLGAQGEHELIIAPFRTPSVKGVLSSADVTQFKIVEIFTNRAKAASSDFVVTNENAAVIGEICRRLDGLPLAIELAAARVRNYSLGEIAAGLDHRFDLLTKSLRTVDPRQQTLRAAIDWSYALLNYQEKAIFRRISVFAGGWTLEAAQAVCAGGRIRSQDVPGLLDSLSDKSLILIGLEGNMTRYGILETIREYGRDRLAAGLEASKVRDKQLEWCIQLAKDADAKMQGPDEAIWLSRLETEHDNMRAALTWCMDRNKVDIGLQLSATLADFWCVRGYWSEGRKWLEDLFANPQNDSRTFAKALNGAGLLACVQSDLTKAEEFYRQSLDISQELDDQQGIAVSLHGLGQTAHGIHDLETAKNLFEESLEVAERFGGLREIGEARHGLAQIACEREKYDEALENFKQSLGIRRSLGDQHSIAVLLNDLGNLTFRMENYNTAREYYQESLSINIELGNRREMALSLDGLGQLAFLQPDYDEAKRKYEEKLLIVRLLGDQWEIAATLNHLGNVDYKMTNYSAAKKHYQESLSISRALGIQTDITMLLFSLGQLADKENQRIRAAYLVGAFTAIVEANGKRLSPDWTDGFKQANPSSSWTTEELTNAWNAGHAMTLPQAIEYALSDDE